MMSPSSLCLGQPLPWVGAVPLRDTALVKAKRHQDVHVSRGKARPEPNHRGNAGTPKHMQSLTTTFVLK